MLMRELPSGVRKSAVREIYELYDYLQERPILFISRFRNRLNSDKPRSQASRRDTTDVTLARSATESLTTG
jgi:hypothetical protein